MKRLAYLVVPALLATSCQHTQPTGHAFGQQIQSVTSAAMAKAPVKSPMLPQVKVKPEAKVSIQGTQVKLDIKLPALSEYQTADFKAQALDLATAAKITATVKDSYGKTYTPVGAVAGEINYPPSGVISMSFENVVPDQLLFVELQVSDGTANIPQADLAVVISHTGVSTATTTMDFLTTPAAKAMKALLVANATRAREINLADLNTLINSITGVTGTAPNYIYTTHPTLVNTALLATDMLAQNPTSLTAATYRLAGATVGLTVSGLVGSDKIEVQSTDAASAIKLAVANGTSSISGATPGTGLKIKVGADAANSTQYTFVATPNNNLTLSNGASTAIDIVATPTAVSITSLTPTFGAIGSSVTIAGSGFSTVAANNIVKFGSTTATVTAATATSLTVTVPAGINGAQDVTVQVGAQTSAASTYNVRPVISSLSATSGAVGSSITLTGTGFNSTPANNTVMFGATAAAVTAASATSLTVTVPTTSGTQNLTVQVGTQTSTAQSFDVTPVLTSLSVSNGIVGSSITLTGTGFSATAANNTVKFGATTATVTAATATSLTVTVPNVFGAQNVNVQVGAQTSGNQNFDVTPNITGLSVTTGSSGDILDISGTGFHSTAGSNTIRLGSTTVTGTLQSPTVLRVTVPGDAAGAANVTVQVATRTSTASNFTILPNITALTTAEALSGKAVLIRNGTLTIDGSNFDLTAANNTVRFTLANSSVVTAPAATVNGAGTQITVAVPGGVDVAGDVGVQVVSNSQTSNSLTGTVPTVSLNVNNGGFH